MRMLQYLSLFHFDKRRTVGITKQQAVEIARAAVVPQSNVSELPPDFLEQYPHLTRLKEVSNNHERPPLVWRWGNTFRVILHPYWEDAQTTVVVRVSDGHVLKIIWPPELGDEQQTESEVH